MNIPSNLCGCRIDPRETDAACNALSAAGCDPIAANRPSLRGSWERNGRRPIFLTDADDDQAWLQHHGTCFPAGSMVLMADGTEKEISRVIPGDVVVSHTGKFRKVLDTQARRYSGKLLSIKSRGCPERVSMTAEHPVAKYWMTKSNQPGGLIWFAANQLSEGDFVLHPFPRSVEKQHSFDLAEMLPESERVVRVYKDPIVGDDFIRGKCSHIRIKRFVTLNKSLGRLLGLYAAEGSLEYASGNPVRVSWTFCGDEMHYAEEVAECIENAFGAKARIIDERPRKNVIRVRCPLKIVATFFSKIIPGKALTKRVPDCIFLIVRRNSQCVFLWMAGWRRSYKDSTETESKTSS